MNVDKIIIVGVIILLLFCFSIFANFLRYNDNICTPLTNVKYINHSITSDGKFLMSIQNKNETTTIDRIMIGKIELKFEKYIIDKNIFITLFGNQGPLGVKGNKYEYNISIFYNNSIDTTLCKGIFT